MAKKKKDWRSDPNGMPDTLFVRQETFAEGREDFLAFQGPADAVEGDGPTPVGTYRLVAVRRLRKRVEEEK